MPTSDTKAEIWNLLLSTSTTNFSETIAVQLGQLGPWDPGPQMKPVDVLHTSFNALTY